MIDLMKTETMHRILSEKWTWLEVEVPEKVEKQCEKAIDKIVKKWKKDNKWKDYPRQK